MADWKNKLSSISNRVAAIRIPYLGEVGSNLSTNRFGGMNYSLMGPGYDAMTQFGPGSLTINAHGLPDRNIYADSDYEGKTTPLPPGAIQRVEFGQLRSELSKAENIVRQSRLPQKNKTEALESFKALSASFPEGTKKDALPISDLVKSLGSKTNDVYSLIVNACYAAGIPPEQWKLYFPNLTNVVQAVNNKQLEYGTSWQAALTTNRPSFGKDYQRPPEYSPLINYTYSPTGIKTNEVQGLEDFTDWKNPDQQ